MWFGSKARSLGFFAGFPGCRVDLRQFLKEISGTGESYHRAGSRAVAELAQRLTTTPNRGKNHDEEGDERLDHGFIPRVRWPHGRR
jgi:hypothetical protein